MEACREIFIEPNSINMYLFDELDKWNHSS